MIDYNEVSQLKAEILGLKAQIKIERTRNLEKFVNSICEFEPLGNGGTAKREYYKSALRKVIVKGNELISDINKISNRVGES